MTRIDSVPPTGTSEFTFRAVALGAILGIVFGLVTVYIALEVGLNFSASIPIAVLAITVFKRLGRPSILEQNIVQTVGSAGESIAAGVVYTMPALLFLGFPMELWRIFWLGLIGGVLGVLFMVPLRHYLVVREHGTLIYPEGTACADILIAGEQGGAVARHVFVGLGVGALYKLLMSGLGLWRSALEWTSTGLRGASLSLDLSPELLGIGYLVGLPVARIIFAGSVLARIVMVPLIYVFGEQLTGPIYPARVPIGLLSPGDVWSDYLRYVGAGAVIAGGGLLLIEALPTVLASLGAGVRGLRRATASALAASRRDQDLSGRFVAGGSLIMLACLFGLLTWRVNPHGVGNVVTTVLVAVLGFFFVVVSARITGLMGSSANPISGITIAVVMLTCLLFAWAGWSGATYEVIAVSVGAVVCVAASNAGTTAQDLKTGYLVGASPRLQQLGLLVGVLTSVLVIGFTVTWLNGALHIGSARLPAPQAQVMAIVVDGLMNHRMQWRLLLVGFMIAVVIELCGVRALPFAVGMYLPLSATAAIMAGALVGHLARRKSAHGAQDSGQLSEDPMQPGILYASGLIAGGAICAIAIAVLASLGALDRIDLGRLLDIGFLRSPALALIMFLALCGLLWRSGRETRAPVA